MAMYKCEVWYEKPAPADAPFAGVETSHDIIRVYGNTPRQAVNRAKRKYCKRYKCKYRYVTGRVTAKWHWFPGWWE